jgi:hypothetical protein
MFACKAQAMDRYQSLKVGDWAVFGCVVTCLFDVMIFVFFCKPADAVEGIFFRASSFDGGVCNVRVDCD